MHIARELNRAHILAALDRKIRVAKRYRTDAEAQVAALACSDPSAGAGRWTVALLTEAARGRPKCASTARIIQELESGFRGAGLNVIKVVWGSGRDKLLAKDKSGLLVQAH